MTSAPVATTSTPVEKSRRNLLARLGRDTAHSLLGLPLAIIAFTLIVTGLSLGGSLLISLVGVPVLAATVFTARGFAEIERARIAPVLGEGRVRVRYRAAGEGATFWRRMLAPLGDLQSWLDVLHALARLPVSVFTFSAVLTWWAMAVSGLTYWMWVWFLPADARATGGLVISNRPLPAVLGFEDTTRNRIIAYLVIGLVFAATIPFVVRACALLEAYVAKSMLNGVATLRHQIADLTEERAAARAQTAAAVSAEATALRRLERDIHDGPQQRLVRLAVDLGRARQQLDADDAGAALATVGEALDQTREALAELRTLSRGIAPPILTDRGLAAAVAALAARSTIPVSVDIPQAVGESSPGTGRLPELAEQTAYFTIAEALTNVAKHSRATRCEVSAGVVDDRLVVTISDDGSGGAHLAKGHGLAGLADRVHSAGGELWVSSPPGGPTRIRAEILCARQE